MQTVLRHLETVSSALETQNLKYNKTVCIVQATLKLIDIEQLKKESINYNNNIQKHKFLLLNVICSFQYLQYHLDIILKYRMDIQQPENSKMDVEEDAHSATQIVTALKRIQNIEKKIHAIKLFSQSRRTARKQLLLQQRKMQIRKLSQQQQQLSKNNSVNPKYRKDSLKGLVIQVPQNKQVHIPTLNPYSPRNPNYYLSQVLKHYKDPQSTVREHLTTSLHILKTLQNSKMPTKQQIKSKILNLQRKPGCEYKKTIVFDLDQTLIHCNENILIEHDLKITIKFPTGQSANAGINIRPGAVQLLKSLKGKYQVMIFTASHSCYANQILDFLDPQGDLIHHRLYRQHCFISNEGYFVKDLRILNRPMKDVLLIDNAAYSYAFQLDNGVPILPYFKGKNDYELRALQSYLNNLLSFDNLREENRKMFKLNRYLEFQGSVDKLVQQLYLI